MGEIKNIIQRLLSGEKLSEQKLMKELGVSKWKASQILTVAKYELNKLKLVYTYKPEKPKNFQSEKQTYKYLEQVLFDISFKVYSPVLKGLPDYIVISTKPKELTQGFYEVKLKGRKLSKHQEKLMSVLALAFEVYLIEVDKNGFVEVFKWK